MQTGSKEGFVDVDVAQAAKELLIEQQRLETRAATVKQRDKVGEFDFKRIGSLEGELGGPGDAAKAPDVVEEQEPLVEDELCSRVRRARAVVE